MWKLARQIKLKHAGFVIGVILLLSGWIIRLIAAFVLPGVVSSEALLTMDKIGTVMSGSSVFFLLGGIVLYGFISSKEDKETPEEPLTEAEEEQKQRKELEDASYSIKNSIPFTAVYGIMSILLTLSSASIVFVNKEKFGWSGIIIGLLLCWYYIRKSIRQFKWLSWYKKTSGANHKVVEEYTINPSADYPILLRVFNNGTAYALFDNYPLNDDEETDRFVAEFSHHINAKVVREDRECFLLMSNEDRVMKKAIAFLQIKSEQWKAEVE